MSVIQGQHCSKHKNSPKECSCVSLSYCCELSPMREKETRPLSGCFRLFCGCALLWLPTCFTIRLTLWRGRPVKCALLRSLRRLQPKTSKTIQTWVPNGPRILKSSKSWTMRALPGSHGSAARTLTQIRLKINMGKKGKLLSYFCSFS